MTIARRTLLSGAALAVVSTPVNARKINNLQDEINKAIETGTILQLPGETIVAAKLQITGSITVLGVAGHTKLVSRDGGPVLEISDAGHVSISGVSFEGKDVPPTDELSRSALVVARGAKHLTIEQCGFSKSPFTGLKLEGCSGRVSNNHFSKLGDYAVFAIDSMGLEISSNDVTDIGNNGILVWRSEIGEDGTQVLSNRISHIRADAGGTGENGNGVNIFRAGNVITANNTINDTAFSCIRYNSGSNALITGNSLSRAGEAALFVEFSYQGAIVSNNIIDGAAWGISITNLDVGGRLAICSNNIIRNITGGMSDGSGEAAGITVQGDSVVAQNLVENVAGIAIRLGWGPFAKNLNAQGNLIRDCGMGIVVSSSEGAGQSLVMGNLVDGAKRGAILALDYNRVTADLGVSGSQAPAHVFLANNVITG